MAHVLVTGGTGTLGRQLVPRLVAQGHDVRVLSRQDAPSLPDGAAAAKGDVLTGAGLDAACDGVDVVVHAAMGWGRRVRRVEVEGTRNVVERVAAGGGHFIYVSIVGVDRHRFPYYRMKHAAERVVESSGARWTIQRATQFHDLIAMFLSRGVFIRTPNLAFQSVAAAEVADRLASLVEGDPVGHAPDFAGPEVIPIRDLAAARESILGRKTRLLAAPRVGFLRDFDEGRHLRPDHRDGTTTWSDWLEESAERVSRPRGSLSAPA